MKIDNSQSVWFKKYQPQQVQDVILPKQFKEKLQKAISSDTMPHLGLFSNIPGTGKSSLANAIANDMQCDVKWVNASLSRGIDVLKGDVGKFVTRESFDGKKVLVILDEFDGFSADGQKAFRGFIDDYSANAVFIFTGNYKERIIAPLLDRLDVFDFASFDKKEMAPQMFERMKFILDTEGVEYNENELIPIIHTHYPSLRSMVGDLQRYTIDGKLSIPAGGVDQLDSYDKIISSMKAKDYDGVVSQVNALATPDNMFTNLYKNLKVHFQKNKRPNIVLILAKYQSYSSTVRDKHLNLSACLTEIMLTI